MSTSSSMDTDSILNTSEIFLIEYDLTVSRIVNTWSEKHVRKVLSLRKFDVDRTNSMGHTILTKFLLKNTISNRDKRIIKLLLDYGADPLFTHDDFDKLTLIYLTLYVKDPELAILLLSYVEDIDCIVNLKENYTPLHFATLWEDETVLKYVLSRNPDVFKRDYIGSTALHKVTMNNNGLAMAECLLEHYHLYEVFDERGFTPLMQGVLGNRQELVKLLIARGANVETRDDEGNTPILLACWMKNLDMVGLLYDRGADLLATNYDGWNTLISLFVTKIRNTSREVFEFLIYAGCNFNALTLYNKPPLHYFLELFKKPSHMFYLDELIRHGVLLNIQNSLGNTELHICAQNRSVPVSVIIYLIRAGSDSSLRNNQNETFIDILIKKNRKHALELIRYIVAAERTGTHKLPVDIRNHINGKEMWMIYLNSCINETDLLISKISKKYSLLELPFLDKKELQKLCHIEVMKTAMENFDSSSFKIYGEIIAHSCRRALDLHEREKHAMSLLVEASGEDLCPETIRTALKLISISLYEKIH